MTLVLKTISSIENRNYAGPVINRILLCCFLMASCCFGIEVVMAQAPAFAKQDMTDRVELADGFQLLKVAGNEQIPDAFSIAAHPSGDLVVSGPGYLRRLKISDKGLEKVTDLPHPPAGGAQGLWCQDNDLYFVGGEGLCRIKGALGDLSNEDLAKLAKPEVLLKIDVGQEHQAHAIRKGPEEWWYLICGNQTELDPKFSSHKDSPVKDPEAGCLLRLDFELEEYQVFAHGFRNAYDFDFGPDGSVYVYDSDGERDVSLPWYRPTRVFRVAPGDHAGWVNKSWKRPSYYPDMPTEVAALGRGSPTGVCYNGQNKMGKQFEHRLFVGDWTFGRINAVDVTDSKKPPVDLLLSKGQFGFAVTDLVIGIDGLLYVTVGGRGTEGGLFRIEPDGSEFSDDDVSGMALATGNKALERKAASEKAAVDLIRECQLSLGGCGGCEGMMAGYTAKRQIDPEIEKLETLDEVEIWLVTTMFLRENPQRMREYLERTTLDKRMRRKLAKDMRILREDVKRLMQSTGGVLLDIVKMQSASDKEIDERLRLLAMLKIRSNKVSVEILRFLASEDDPVRGIHLLTCYSIIAESTSSEQAAQIGQFLTGLKRKIADRKLNTDRNWEPRMKELVAALAKHPQIGRAIVDSPSLGARHTLYVAEALMNAPSEHVNDSLKTELANVILAWCRKYPKQTTARHVKLFQKLPDAASFLRSSVGGRAQLLSPTVDALFETPVEADRATFVRGLGADRLQTQKNSAIGLRRLLDRGADSLSFDETQVALTTLSRLGGDRPATSVRKQLILMLKSSFAKEDGYSDGDLTETRQFLEKRFGQPFKPEVDGAVDVDQWLAKFAWNKGNVERGEVVFAKAQCAACHQSGGGQLTSSALGPSLEGVTKRFSQRALFQSILDPNRDVADRYRAVLVETEDGEFVAGLKVYQSADGITLLLADGSTARINGEQIAELKQSKQSLMPARLLDNLTPTEIADLWAFLTTL